MSREGAICGVIAAYNAQGTIGEVVAGVRRYLGTVLVADDGSTDGTAEAAREAGADVILVRENRGKGHALRLLFAEARRRGLSGVIALDADGQHDADDIPSFLAVHRVHPEAIITGSRMGAPEGIPRHRRNAMFVARFFISLAANQFIEDTQCGFRLYPLSVIESISLLKERYVTETEVLIKAGDSGRPIQSLAIKAQYPEGHPTHFRTFRDIAAISRYVISYLMVKWAIEAVRPRVVNTYRGPGTSRDRFCLSPRLDLVFESLTVTAALPLSVLYSFWRAVARHLSIPVLQSLDVSGLPVRGVLASVLLLPLLLVVAAIDLIGHRLHMNMDRTSRFVQRHYAEPWCPR